MAKIYIVLTQTGTILSKAVKYCSKKDYNHASIALDQNLDELYSFGRINPYNPIAGGFVHEGITFGTFKRFKDTKAKIYELDVTDEQYAKIAANIDYIKKNKGRYKFNKKGLVLASLNKIKTYDNHFYCSEFVKYVLKESGIDVSALPDITHPLDFEKLEGLKLIYKDLLRDYESPSVKNKK